jgi:mRNA interferase HicA
LKGSEFVSRVQKAVKEKGIHAEYRSERGKGSYGTPYFGSRRTIVGNLKDELKTGTFHAMLKQLGLKMKDLE